MPLDANSEELHDYDMMLVGAMGDPDEFPEPDPFADFIYDIQNLNGTLGQKKRKVRALLEAMDVQEEDFIPAELWDAFLDRTDDSYDYLWEGGLERGERVICVAAEGVGKTMLMRQVAICLAAGLHPFTGQTIEKLRTTTVDCENPEKIISRTSRKMMRLAKERSYGDVHAYLKRLPMGVNLLKAPGRAQIEAIIQQTKPDILFMGPLYKMFIDPGGRSAEAIATELAMYLDYLREEYNVALWLEQHAPLGNGVSGRDLRPFGSSVWSRWPEFGINISKDPTDPSSYKFGVFRGMRDDREFPETAHRGGPQDFPFVVDSFMSH
jgi:replicative DNA helicase